MARISLAEEERMVRGGL